MPVLRQKSSFGPGKYRGINFDRNRLQQFVDGTNKAIAAGVPIPLLDKRHAKPGAGDKETQDEADVQGAGWLTKLELDENDSIVWEAKDVPQSTIDEVNAGTKRYTSPEFRSHYENEKEGVYSGPIVRHITFTPLPGNPHQGEIETIALSEGIFQFSETDREVVEQFADAEHGESDLDGPEETNKGKAKKGKKKGKLEGEETLKGEIGEVDEQYAESAAQRKKVLLKHGYTQNRAHPDLYSHKDGHTLALIGDGEFRHTGKDGLVITGKGHKELNDKLNTYHQTQHGEKPDFTEGDSELDGEEVVNDLPIESPTEPINPDMPPVSPDMAQLQAVIAGLAQKQVILPSDWNPFADPAMAMKLLLTGLNTSIKVEQDAEMEKAQEEQEDAASGNQVVTAPMPYSEQNPDGYYVPLTDEQFNETHDCLTGYGYKKNKGKHPKGYGIYATDDNSNHAIIAPSGHWTHIRSNEDDVLTIHTGHGHDSLKKHVEKVHDPESQHDEEQPQFSEDELAVMTPKARAIIEQAEATRIDAAKKVKEAQFAEVTAKQNEHKAKVDLARTNAISSLANLNLPPALKRKFEQQYQEVQFSEDGKEPKVLSLSEAAQLVVTSLPKNLLFPINDVTIAKPPVSDQFFETKGGRVTPEQANAHIANSALSSRFGMNNGGHIPTIAESIAKSNADNPMQPIKVNERK